MASQVALQHDAENSRQPDQLVALLRYLPIVSTTRHFDSCTEETSAEPNCSQQLQTYFKLVFHSQVAGAGRGQVTDGVPGVQRPTTS